MIASWLLCVSPTSFGASIVLFRNTVSTDFKIQVVFDTSGKIASKRKKRITAKNPFLPCRPSFTGSIQPVIVQKLGRQRSTITWKTLNSTHFLHRSLWCMLKTNFMTPARNTLNSSRCMDSLLTKIPLRLLFAYITSKQPLTSEKGSWSQDCSKYHLHYIHSHFNDLQCYVHDSFS
jgi:hypothetical protein